MIVTSIKGEVAEVMPLSQCVCCGWAPHHVGPEGALTCAACRVREAVLQANRAALSAAHAGRTT